MAEELQVNIQIAVHPDLIDDEDLPHFLEVLGDTNALLVDCVLSFAEKQQHDAFESQGQSIGQEWAPLAPKTLIEKAYKGYPEQSLVRTGRLEGAIASKIHVSGDSISVGFDADVAPYGVYHNEGYGVPKRMFINIIPSQLMDLQNRIIQWFAERLGNDAGAIQVKVT